MNTQDLLNEIFDLCQTLKGKGVKEASFTYDNLPVNTVKFVGEHFKQEVKHPTLLIPCHWFFLRKGHIVFKINSISQHVKQP